MRSLGQHNHSARSLVAAPLALALALALAGCVGAISDKPGARGNGNGNGAGSGNAGSSGAGSGSSGAIDVNAAAVDSVSPAWTRRLTKTEIGNAVGALTNVKPASVAMLPDDALDFDFDRVAQSQTVIDRHVQGYLAIADEVAATLTGAGLAALVPACASVDRACAQAVIDTLGKRAFRRPVAPEQGQLMLGLFDGAGGGREGVNQVIRFILQSPSFIYLIERGAPVAGKPGLLALDDYEVAARLSLFACETVPDAALLAAADAGQLRTPDQIGAQAKRLFALPCARQTVQRFFSQWFHLGRVATIMPDTAANPLFTADARQAMIDEDQRFLDYLTWDSPSPLSTVFNADFSFVDSRLGPIYGLTGLPATLGKVTMPPERRGLLTHASLLTALSNPAATSPVRRGAFIYRKVLCQDISPPPPTLDTSPPKDDPTLTTRQRYALRTENGVCAGCHTTINPIGYALENFDAIGKLRATDNGLPVDATGAIPGTGVTGLDGGASLSMAVADMDELRVCFAREWLRFGLGRNESQADVTSLRPIVDLARGGASMQDMMVSLARTFAFSHRAVPADGGTM